MCPCDLFPAYSAKLHCNDKLPPELDGLCLSCAFYLCVSLANGRLGDPAPVLRALGHWLGPAEAEVSAFYTSLYSTAEAARFSKCL